MICLNICKQCIKRKSEKADECFLSMGYRRGYVRADGVMFDYPLPIVCPYDTEHAVCTGIEKSASYIEFVDFQGRVKDVYHPSSSCSGTFVKGKWVCT
jgi:hypothetical protein